MVSYTSLLAASATLFTLTAAAPSNYQPSRPNAIHRIFAGSSAAEGNPLRFEPQNVVAEIGDIIEFHFLAKNHTVVQSSFDKPCEPLAGGAGFFSGFNFATAPGLENKQVFSFPVTTKEPIWYYCSQTAGTHCQAGMSGVINQNFDGDKTLAAYKAASVNTVTVQPSEDKLASQGGAIGPNYLCGQSGFQCTQ